jgi:hypothetical protein
MDAQALVAYHILPYSTSLVIRNVLRALHLIKVHILMAVFEGGENGGNAVTSASQALCIGWFVLFGVAAVDDCVCLCRYSRFLAKVAPAATDRDLRVGLFRCISTT